jgi:hypothetical protein
MNPEDYTEWTNKSIKMKNIIQDRIERFDKLWKED